MIMSFWAIFLLCSLAIATPSFAEVRVMSFNIRYGTADDGPNHWEQRKELLLETIRRFGPDLLGTQETLAFQRDYLAVHFDSYDQVSAGREDGKEKGEMTALFFRRDRFEKVEAGHFWLSTTPDQPGSRGWDAALPRMVTWVRLRDRSAVPAREFLFANTHFDHQGRQARLESARLLREKLGSLAKGQAVVLTGDFNSPEASPPYVALFDGKSVVQADTEQAEAIANQADNADVGNELSGDTAALGLRDTYRVAHPTPGPEEGTFCRFNAAETHGPRIDWIGVSAGWQVGSAEIVRDAKNGSTPSDHFPVAAILDCD